MTVVQRLQIAAELQSKVSHQISETHLESDVSDEQTEFLLRLLECSRELHRQIFVALDRE